MKFYKGVDISSLTSIEKNNGLFYHEGKADDLMHILKFYNTNSVRLRLWVDPFDENGLSYQGGDCSLENIINLAKRAKENDLEILLDLHYSDFWADPGKQFIPKDWKNLSHDELTKQVYHYTYEVIQRFINENIEISLIQIGNEITNGMLWPKGYLTYNQVTKTKAGFKELITLLNAGIKAVRELSKNTKIILHLDRGGDNIMYRQWFDEMEKEKVDYDIIGLSYYPYWHGSMIDLKSNLSDLRDRYHKPLMIVETAYAHTLDNDNPSLNLVVNKDNINSLNIPYEISQDGQVQFLIELFKVIKEEKVSGVFYWEPAWLPVSSISWASYQGRCYIKELHKNDGNEWANQGLFTYQGQPVKAWQIWKKEKN